MKKLNSKGFTLVEVLAVIVILGVLAAITVPAVSSVMEQNKQNGFKNLQKSIISAAKIYISDNKYNITLSGTCGTERPIGSVLGNNISNSQIPIKLLVDSGDLNDGNGNIVNPQNRNQKLDLTNSYITVKYDCDTKGFKYENPVLNWQ